MSQDPTPLEAVEAGDELVAFDFTTRVTLERKQLDTLKIVIGEQKPLEKAIAEAFGLTGKFNVFAYGWNFRPDDDEHDEDNEGDWYFTESPLYLD